MTRSGILPITKFPDDFEGSDPDEGGMKSGPQEFDDQGNAFERCQENDNGHLYFHGWCLHCHSEER